MPQRSLEPVTSRRSDKLGNSKLDRAMFASVAAMVTMCVFVLAQQLQAVPLFATANSVGATLA